MKTDIIPYQKMTAEAILYKENDPLLRYAIYKAYKYRCAYTGKFLYDYSSIHLDHIIPQDTAPEVLQEKIRKYHLADDFTIDSLENILPTKSLHNNSQKNRHPFSEPAERFFLEYAQRGKWKIEREYKILKKQFELSKLKVFAEAQLVEFNLLPPEVYKASRKVTNSLSIHNHFWRSTENIALNGFLPSKLKEEGSCVISFCNRTIMITLDHKTILQLINKLETYSLNDIILRGHSYQNTKTFVVLGNNAVHLENAVYEELLDILQDYLKVYSEEYSKFQKYIGAENFSFYKDTNDYMLLETSRENWRKLIQYARKFDTEQGTTSEYCFNSNDHHLLAISAQNNIKFRLLPANSIKNEDSFLFPDDQLWKYPIPEAEKPSKQEMYGLHSRLMNGCKSYFSNLQTKARMPIKPFPANRDFSGKCWISFLNRYSQSPIKKTLDKGGT